MFQQMLLLSRSQVHILFNTFVFPNDEAHGSTHSPAYCGIVTWKSFMSRDMAVSVVTRPWVRQRSNRGSIPGRVKKNFCPLNCPPNLLRSGYIDMKRSNQEADHSPTPSVDVKDEYSYTSRMPS
jgi:hypothetical protein